MSLHPQSRFYMHECAWVCMSVHGSFIIEQRLKSRLRSSVSHMSHVSLYMSHVPIYTSHVCIYMSAHGYSWLINHKSVPCLQPSISHISPCMSHVPTYVSLHESCPLRQRLKSRLKPSVSHASVSWRYIHESCLSMHESCPYIHEYIWVMSSKTVP